jgi:hypothetical protein
MGGRRSLIDRPARGAGADELPSGGKSVYKMAVAGKEKNKSITITIFYYSALVVR